MGQEVLWLRQLIDTMETRTSFDVDSSRDNKVEGRSGGPTIGGNEKPKASLVESEIEVKRASGFALHGAWSEQAYRG
jgi:hypothetical protein